MTEGKRFHDALQLACELLVPECRRVDARAARNMASDTGRIPVEVAGEVGQQRGELFWCLHAVRAPCSQAGEEA